MPTKKKPAAAKKAKAAIKKPAPAKKKVVKPAIKKPTTPSNKYRKKSAVVVATQWLKDGDHPKVKPAQKPEAETICPSCGRFMHTALHGKIDISHYGPRIVCPGSWLIEVAGCMTPSIMSDNAFKVLYELAE